MERSILLTAFEDQDLSNRVSEMIRATIKHQVPVDSPADLPLFLDLDLEVLAVSSSVLFLAMGSNTLS
jgi:predicted metal-dependent HD superfamily phosphohydrolase